MSLEITALTDRLAPADGETIAKHLLSLRKAGMAIPSGMKPDDLEPVYTYALSDVPAFGLRRAVEKIIKGEYQIKYGFMPLPPELAAMARAEARTLREDLSRLRAREATLADIAKGPPPEPDESTKERVRHLREQFKRFHAEQKAQERGVAIHEPMTPERAAHWEKIMALPDAKEISAEQQAFRRKVEMDVAAAEPKRAAE